MVRPGFVDGVEDMIADADRLDAADRGRINQVQRNSIVMLRTNYDFSAEDIADHLWIELDLVQEILAAYEASPKI
ncbi:hypothetical protein D9M68_487310 [compost metagenome]